MDWFEDDQFWIRFAPVMFDSTRWENTSWEVDGVLSMADIPDGSEVLDSCCGVGRHSLEFGRRGYKVTAVDRTRAYIDAARDSAETEQLSIDFVLQDVRDFRRPDTYTLAMNMFTSFGFFSSMEEEKQYISNIRDTLKSGGLFLIDVNGKEIISRDFKPLEQYTENGITVRGEYKILDDFSVLNNRWSIEEKGENYSFEFSHRIYSAAELKELLLECGFSRVTVYGGFDGRPYDTNAQRLITIAEKA